MLRSAGGSARGSENRGEIDGIGRKGNATLSAGQRRRQPSEFLSDDRSMLDADRDMRVRGLDLLAVYHSHPTSPAVPSRTDLERHWYADVVCMIVRWPLTPPEVRAWWLTETEYREAEWEVIAEIGLAASPLARSASVVARRIRSAALRG